MASMNGMTDNKTAIVTGGAVRVGGAISLALAKAGYDIALHYHQSQTQAEAVAREIEAIGQSCQLFQSDLAEEGAADALMSSVLMHYEQPTLLINSASIFHVHSFLDTDESTFDRYMNVNLRAPFFLTQSFAKKVKKGSIINILDTYVTKHSERYFSYLLSKKALFAFTEMAARQLAPDLRINALALGHILPSEGENPNWVQTKEQTLPLKQYATLDDVCRSLFTLLDNPALIGQCLFVDGGDHLL